MISFQVNDMSCGHCVSAITRAVQEADEAAVVRVDLATKQVQVEPAAASAEAVAEAIREAGYSPVRLES
ncbi:heavy-metal-associated domain-containing protein [Piscinibacter sp. HJYY11]|uniref:heavy-metal-associated domain-containing protein n=1 Tax=Piscinibacter sp. HJYY11 TaxID=2801333 RepID=UPI0028732F41|nr:heavy-metal-associated domain-containing protein [Piscinibacter sp. HJYY11]